MTDPLHEKIRRAQVAAAEKVVCDSLPAIFGMSKAEFERRMNAPYVWPSNEYGPLPQGDCSACRHIDARHPRGTACDYSCVGV